MIGFRPSINIALFVLLSGLIVACARIGIIASLHHCIIAFRGTLPLSVIIRIWPLFLGKGVLMLGAG